MSCEAGHGRIDTRRAAVAAITPVRVGLPAARSVIAVARDWIRKNRPDDPPGHHLRHFISSLPLDDKHRAAAAVRGHWSIENRNHRKRDTCPWREDDHRHRRVRGAQNLALTRNALLAIIPFDDSKPLSHWLDHYHRHHAQAIMLILTAHPFP